MNNSTKAPRLWSLGRHFRRNLVAYVALVVAVSMSPLPSEAAQLIGTKSIKNSAVTTKKLRDSAVTTTKIADGVVGTADLGAGSVKGSKLGTLVERQGAVTLPNGGGGEATATCLPGEKLLTGGNSTQGVGSSAGFNLIRAQRSLDGNGWVVVAHNSVGNTVQLFALAYCLQ